jgi:D-lactate dehydrogenase
MDVRGVDLIEKHSDIDYVTIEQGVGEADVIICAMNLTSENKGYFDYELLSKARQSAVFVNIARGELSPSCELLRLLKEKKIGGVGLDVYNHESDLAVALRSAESIEDKEIESTLALGEYPNVILTPHNAFNTRESVERKAEQSIQQICHFIENGQFLWPVPD